MAQAERDLAHAEWSLRGEFYEWACFIAQQSAEKAVKAVYQAQHAVAWGHSISKLIQSLLAGMQPDAELVERGIRLDRFYIQPRYPNGFDVGSPGDYYTRRDAEGAIEDAREIIRACQRYLS
jgi:HEPN domain-containing protein